MEYLKEYRCKYCNKMFFKGEISKATIEIKCRNCKNFNVIEGKNCTLSLVSDERGKYKSGSSKTPKMEAIIKCDDSKKEGHDKDKCPNCNGNNQ